MLKEHGAHIEDFSELIAAAVKARENAYAPYSKFRVGAAVLDGTGRIYPGCNVENASFGATVCAERIAVFGAISLGARDIRAIAIVADYHSAVPPCGMCRQVLAEFGQDIIVIMANLAGEQTISTVRDLLPLAFSLKNGEGHHGGFKEEARRTSEE